MLSPGDVERVRQRSKAKNSGPWRTDYDAMAKKTAIRQLFKLLPKSTELAHAVAHDGTVRRDTSTDGFDTPPDYIEGELVDASEESTGADESHAGADDASTPAAT